MAWVIGLTKKPAARASVQARCETVTKGDVAEEGACAAIGESEPEKGKVERTSASAEYMHDGKTIEKYRAGSGAYAGLCRVLGYCRLRL
jgi:hypothetical protein